MPTRGDAGLELVSKIIERSIRIGVIGQGYVGLPLTLLFNEAGFEVLGFDVDPTKVGTLISGKTGRSVLDCALLPLGPQVISPNWPHVTWPLSVCLLPSEGTASPI